MKIIIEIKDSAVVGDVELLCNSICHCIENSHGTVSDIDMVSVSL